MEDFSTPSPEPNATGKKKMNKNLKVGCIMSVIVLLLFIVGFWFIGNSLPDNPAATENTAVDKTIDEPKLTPEQIKAKEEARIAKEVADQLAAIQSRMEGIENTEKDPSNFRGDIYMIKSELSMFYALYSEFSSAEKSSNKEVQLAGAKLKKRTIAFQKSEFPKMRQAYFDIIYNPFWKENITTKLKGPNKTHIQFLGVVFASNKNIDDFQNNLNSILHALRFKKAGYSWNEYDGYSTYTLKTPPDDELITTQPD